MSDKRWYPYKLSQIKYKLNIQDFVFKNCLISFVVSLFKWLAVAHFLLQKHKQMLWRSFQNFTFFSFSKLLIRLWFLRYRVESDMSSSLSNEQSFNCNNFVEQNRLFLFLNEFFRFKCNCIACTKQWPMHEFLTKTVTKPGTQQKTTSFSNILNFKNLYCVENPQNKNFPDQNRFLKCFFFISRL